RGNHWIFCSPGLSQHGSTSTWPKFVMPSRVPPSIAACGLRTKEDRWMAEQSTLGFGNAPGTRSDFRSICIAFAMPLRLFGRSAIQRTSEEQRIYLAILHLEQRKTTMSWRSPVSQVERSLWQLAE